MSEAATAGGTPAFTLFDEATAQNPYPTYARLRREAPVSRIGSAGLWAVARYQDVVRILRDPETFSSVVGAKQLSGEQVQPSMLFSDPPIHTRLRGLVAKAFTPRVVELQRPAVQAYSNRLIDAMLARDEADVVADLAYPLPVQVIATMLGVADGDLATFKRWSDAIIEHLGVLIVTGDDSALADVNRDMDAYFRERLAKLRREPEDNLLSELVHVETEDGRLTEDELLMFCRLLLVAGNETTTGLIVNAVRAFAEFPEALDRVRSDLRLLPGAIEEALRYYAPFQATFRRATRDVEVAGQLIRANERLLVLLASANRDETVFPRPDEFDITREPNRHVSFGMGIHYCVGAPLARLEAQVALGTLLPRIRRVHVTETEAGQLLRPGGPKSFRVRFEAA
ncbi:MAG TPA: cytochrome P450 [Dehalococcoidia bacterium]